MTNPENTVVNTITQILNACPVTPLAESFWGRIILKKERNNRSLFPDAAVEKAGSWTTCACGKLSPNLQRGRYARPTDFRLRQLGMDFYRDIKGGNAIQAAETLVRIEVRSDVLIGRQTAARQHKQASL